MADKISGYGRVGLDVAPARSRPVSRPDAQAKTGASERPRGGGDAVEITDVAARMKAVEARLANLPEVDEARVKAVRERIDSGNYQPDAARIARKLANLERQLV
jgi:negative regulator of flagellin synthesis FlgM